MKAKNPGAVDGAARTNPARDASAVCSFQRLTALCLIGFLTYFPGLARCAAPAGIGVTYTRDEVKEVPWRVHVVRIERNRPELQIITTMGRGTEFGMSLVSDQIKKLPAHFGKPLAAINGDFYSTERKYPGDPEGLQIVRGELVSAPDAQRSCAWIDAAGNPHMTNIAPAFQVTWPNGTKTPFGLNQGRASATAVLYTSANGSSTRCSSGTELVLERDSEDGPWLPLQVGKTYSARVRLVNPQANSVIAPNTAVLSMSSSLFSKLPRVSRGDIIKLSTSTVPEITGAVTGVGGGPAIVRGGRALPFKSNGRHPRSAFGWNDRHFFMVEVDGRQSFSVGMTYAELGSYLVKLGCTEAINLDGGGSATLWVYGSVVNSPSEGRERPSANAIVVVQQKEAETAARNQ